MDPFGPSDLAREYDLSANEVWLLTTLAVQSEFRSGQWTGSQGDLADATRLSRNTIPRCLVSLDAKGLIDIVEPFRQGRQGRVTVLVKDRIIPNARLPQIAQNHAISDGEDRAPIAHRSRSNRAPIAQSCANDLRERGGSRVVRAVREGGEVADETGEVCWCGELVTGHSFSHKTSAVRADAVVADDPPLPDDDDLDRWATRGSDDDALPYEDEVRDIDEQLRRFPRSDEDCYA